MLSIVVPCYNEEEAVSIFAVKAKEEFERHGEAAGIPYELVFIDDGSTDGTWDAIEAVKARDAAARVIGVKLSRNFGKESAISAGLKHARGDCCVTIDADLQHPLTTVREMYDKWLEGYEVIEGVKEDRGRERLVHKKLAGMFYSLFSQSTGINLERASDFKLIDRKVIDAINELPESEPFYRALSHWVGFKSCEVPFSVQERSAGVSKWSGRALTKYAVNSIAAFSADPLQIVTLLGAIAFLFSLVFGGIAVVQWVMGTAIGGFTTVIILLVFMSSIIMISLGIIGYYLGRIYEEVKRRPRYFVDKTI